MDQSAPDPAPTPSPPAAQSAAPYSPREERIVRRLQARVETNELVITWARGWVSREMRLHGLFAARTLDFAALTDRWLFLLNTGFFTRRPRRCVYAARLAEIFVAEEKSPRGTRLRITSAKGRPLWLELKSNEQTDAFAEALIARARVGPDAPARAVPPPESP